MHTSVKGMRLRSRLAALALLLGAGAGLAGCNDMLKVTNPGAIEPSSLDNAGYIALMVNGVIGEFQNAHAYTAMYSGVFVDELRNHHVYFENRDMDLRRVGVENGTYAIYVWNTLHRSRFMSDSVATRLRTLLGDTASSDLRLARVLAYGGLTYTYMGENLCETPINASAGHSPAEVFALALPRFDEAITVATAARARAAAVTPSTAASRATVAGADTILAFARVGAARAALDLGDHARAITYAQAVAPAYTSAASPGLVVRVAFLENTFNNPMWAAMATASGGGNRWVSVRNTPFDSISDPRIPMVRKTVMNAEDATLGGPFVPNSPASYSTYDGTPTGADLTKSSSVRVASALEARYIQAEAEGLTAANLAFINERRGVGGEAALPGTTTAAEFLVALRGERAREFFADGHRLGDLRRYDAQYASRADNLWQTGTYPGTTSGETYGDQKCWPVPLSELQGNPHYF